MSSAFDAGRIQDSTDDVISDTDQVFDAASSEHDHRVFLQIMPDAGDISGHFHAVGEANPRDLSQGGVRLLGSGGGDFDADTALERRRVINWTIL